MFTNKRFTLKITEAIRLIQAAAATQTSPPVGSQTISTYSISYSPTNLKWKKTRTELEVYLKEKKDQNARKDTKIKTVNTIKNSKASNASENASQFHSFRLLDSTSWTVAEKSISSSATLAKPNLRS